MAAHGSSVASVFSGVRVVGGGGMVLVPDESFPPDVVDRVGGRSPVDMLRYSVLVLGQSKSVRWSWPFIRPQGL